MSEECITWDDLARMKKQLKENAVPVYTAILHPKIYNGFWYVGKNIPLFRWLGHKLRSKRVYWLGFQVHWISGVKDLV